MGETAKALRTIFARHDHHVAVFDYSEREDFDRLWNALDGEGDDISENIVLICWTGTALDPAVAPVDTRPHITPLDWAACAALARRELRVIVFDLDSLGHKKDHAVKLYANLDRSQFPWLHVLQISDVAQRFSSSEELLLLFSLPDRAENDSSYEVFLEMRRAALTAPHSSDRHAVTNLIGPIALLGGSGPKTTGHAKALWRLLRCAGLIPQEAAVAVKAPNDTLQRLTPVRVVLLDDQWRHGWAEWVAKKLGLTWNDQCVTKFCDPQSKPACLLGDPKSGISLWVSDMPYWLLDRLENALRTNGMARARFQLRLTGDDADAGEILLCDLRLFSNDDDDNNNRKFVRSAMTLARKFHARQTSLPWPEFTDPELRHLNAYAKGSVSNEAYPTALSILPRLVALTDMSLPIILFSSTGRRDIVEKLKGYKSIVTRFSKPRFFGDIENTQNEANLAFNKALEKATDLLCGRRVIAFNLPPIGRANPVTDQKYQHASLYLDESGNVDDPPFTVGGILALFSTADKEENFDRLLKDQGLHWGPESEGGLNKYTEIAGDRDSQTEKSGQKIIALAAEQGIALKAVALTMNNPNNATTSPIGPKDLRPERALDRLHRTLIRGAVEVTLFHLISDVEMAKQWTFGVCTDVRSMGIATLKLGHHFNELRDDFGLTVLHNDEDKDKVSFMGPDAVLPIIEDLLSRYEGTKRLNNIRVTRARACFLPEGKPAACNRINKSLHFFADWVVGIIRKSHQNRSAPPPSWVRTLLESGCDEFYDETDMEKKLRIARWGLRSDEEIVRAAAGLIELGEYKGESRLQKQCASVVAKALLRSKGDAFVDACFKAKSP